MAGKRIPLIFIMSAHETSGVTLGHASVTETAPNMVMFRFSAHLKHCESGVFCLVFFSPDCFVGRFISQIKLIV